MKFKVIVISSIPMFEHGTPFKFKLKHYLNVYKTRLWIKYNNFYIMMFKFRMFKVEVDTSFKTEESKQLYNTCNQMIFDGYECRTTFENGILSFYFPNKYRQMFIVKSL